MKRKQFLEKIPKDWIAIVACIGIALVVYLSYQATTLDKKTFVIPLTIEATGTMVPSQSTEKYRFVKLTVRAEEDQLASITEDDFTAHVDLTYLTKPGQYSLPVVIQPKERVLLLEPLELLATPDYVNITVDENILRYVPLTASVAGTPAYGYEVSSFTCEPEYVKVYGPAAQVNAVSAIPTEALVVEGLSESVSGTVTVVYDNPVVRLAEDAGDISVSVQITPVQVELPYAGVPIALVNVPAGYEAHLATSSISVSARGTQLLMDTVRPSSFTARADCQFLTESGEYILPVTVTAPSGVTVTEQSFADVTVVISPVQTEAEETN
ncbi:MAG: hypothetical protein IIT68_01245 [Treponema sp.]|nr:hypothetical protein [Treponema sp.]